MGHPLFSRSVGRANALISKARRPAIALRSWVLLPLLVAAAWQPLPAEDIARLLILHTNDLHDHVRPGVGGIGGLAYQAGHIAGVRSGRDDVLLVDGGDVTEKGDLVAYLTRSEIAFEAMARMGYHAVALGNHDHDFGPDQVHRFEQLMGQRFLCMNIVHSDGSPEFEPSRMVEINGITVGLIGLIAPRRAEQGGLDFETSGRQLAAEAARLKETVHLVVAVCHHATQACVAWSRMAPAVDVFVAAHNHDTLFEPVVVPETGALVVQAGSDGRWVGHLHLEIDRAARRIVSHQGELVLMDHTQVSPDEDILAMVAAREAALCPEANDFVIEVDEAMGWIGLARLAAEVMREYAGAEVAFCHPRQIMRNALAAGPATLNAIFRTAAERVEPVLVVELTGAEIAAYLRGLAASDWGLTQWAGLKVEGPMDNLRLSGLDAERRYRTVMPWREWDRYFVRVMARPSAAAVRRAPEDYAAEPAGFTYLEAMVAYLRELSASGEPLSRRLATLRERQGLGDPSEAFWEARTLRAVDFDGMRARVAAEALAD